MKIAFFTPLSPVRSGISDYSEELLPHLAEYCEVDVFTDERAKSVHRADHNPFRCYSYPEFDSMRRQHYDMAVFQIGNAPWHVEAYDWLLRYGGLMVLHELNISGIIGAKTLAQDDWAGFLRQMLVTEGPKAFMSVAARFLLTKRFPEPDAYYMNRLAIERSRGIVVHNQYMKDVVADIVSSRRHDIPVWKVLHHAVVPNTWIASGDMDTARNRLGLAQCPFVVGSFGFMSDAKRVPVALRAFSRLLTVVPDAIYVLVGETPLRIREEIASLGLHDSARVVGYVDMRTFYLYIAATDFCVNLRYPSAGETSGSLLRIMGMGKTVAVTNYAQFREYPDDCCIKIDLGDKEEEMLFDQMLRMARNSSLRAKYGQAAQRYILEKHSPERTARGYYAALRAVVDGE